MIIVNKVIKYKVLILIVLLPLISHAHSSWRQHANDMYDVFGFNQSAEITEWMRYISSDMIDGYNKEKIFLVDSVYVGFYDYLKYNFPGFKCKHRLLFHWGYNSRPWTPELQSKVEALNWDNDKIADFQQFLVSEQARRNRIANEATENLFSFEHGGSDARLARAIISIAYDVHILGDYTPDNRDFDGLCEFSSVIGDIINNLRIIDKQKTKQLIKNIQRLSTQNISEQEKANEILLLLKSNLRVILRGHRDKRISNLISLKDYEVP